MPPAVNGGLSIQQPTAQEIALAILRLRREIPKSNVLARRASAIELNEIDFRWIAISLAQCFDELALPFNAHPFVKLGVNRLQRNLAPTVQMRNRIQRLDDRAAVLERRPMLLLLPRPGCSF